MGRQRATRDITLSTGSFAVQSLWDNASGACQMSPVAPPPPPPPPPAATTVTTSLAGGAKTGTVITVPSGTAVQDSATLAGANAATATGTVTYTVYSDAACSAVAAAGAAQAIGSPGALPSSKAVTLAAAGTYYWKASYSGNANNAASASTCGPAGEVETVTASPPPPVRGPSVDKTASALGKSSVAAGITTTASSDLLVAYVAGRGPSGKAQAAAVTAGMLKWTLVSRSDAGRGDAEVWYARAAGKVSKLKVTATLKYVGFPVAITVVAYKNATGLGRHALAHASKGAPTGSLTTSHAGSWVFAVGDDWAKAAGRTPGPGQSLVHQTGDRAGDTYWVQATKRATKAAGTKVTINDIKPSGDPYNLVLVEIR